MMKELKDIPKQTPFKVPENYFEEVNRKILSKTAGIDTGDIKKSILFRLKPYLAAAAAVAVLAVLSYTAFQIFTTYKDNSGLPAITISEFSENYLNEIDLLTLEQGAESAGLPQVATGFSNIDIIDYLVFENIDIYDIYENL
jgi:hypothetical protein